MKEAFRDSRTSPGRDCHVEWMPLNAERRQPQNRAANNGKAATRVGMSGVQTSVRVPFSKTAKSGFERHQAGGAITASCSHCCYAVLGCGDMYVRRCVLVTFLRIQHAPVEPPKPTPNACVCLLVLPLVASAMASDRRWRHRATRPYRRPRIRR